MKNKMPQPAAPVSSPGQPIDTHKLASLLALATGAVVMPQTGNADIIYTDLSSSPVLVGYAGTIDSFLFNLPGTVQFGFQRQARSVQTQPYMVSTRHYRTVVAGGVPTGPAAGGKIQGAVNAFAAAQPFGAAWDQGLGLFTNVAVGVANSLAQNPAGSYDHQYLAWEFKDSTQLGALRYGWAEVSLNMTFNNSPGGGPNVTIFGYAYDNTGAKPTMGQQAVPEPTSMALMVLGALTFGARGLRSWRRQRDTACPA